MSKPKFKNAEQLADASIDEIKKERAAIFARMDYLFRTANSAGRDMTADERREYDALEKVFDGIGNMERLNVVEPPGAAATVCGDFGATAAYREGAPLTNGQSFRGFARAMGHTSMSDHGADEPLSLSKYIRGSLTGDWRGAETEYRNAMSGGSTGAGGFLLPTVLTANLIDLARAKTRVLEAGARAVPMENRTVDVPRWASDPAPAWRAENAAIAESDATLEKITLTAKSLAVVTKVSRELIEDTDVDDELRAAFAAAFALKLDSAALYGAGSATEPTGVKTNASVTKTSLGTNGGTPTWDTLVDAVGRLRDNNEEPTAQILADRTGRTLAKIKASDGSYVAPPSYLDGVDRLATSQVPTNLTVGTSTDTSDVFTADWTQLYIGVRTSLQVTLLAERYMPDAGQYGFVAWWRGDIVVARPKAFDVVTGVRP